MTRKIDASDLNSAVRGLGMWKQPDEYLANLIEMHGAQEAFASQVIAEAAHQVLAARRLMGTERQS